METARIAALLKPFLDESLSDFQLQQISIYIDLLLRWNSRINLTAIRNPEEIVTRHFGESLFLARHLLPHECHPERSRTISEAHRSAESKDPYTSTEPVPLQGVLPTPLTALDIGSGAGFPALPLKIWEPNLALILIESNHKKSAFLSEAARVLKLKHVAVLAERAETIGARPERPQADVVTFRAVEHFEAILKQAVKLLKLKGKLALLVGEAQVTFLTAQPGLHWNQPLPIPHSERRTLMIGGLN